MIHNCGCYRCLVDMPCDLHRSGFEACRWLSSIAVLRGRLTWVDHGFWITVGPGCCEHRLNLVGDYDAAVLTLLAVALGGVLTLAGQILIDFQQRRRQAHEKVLRLKTICRLQQDSLWAYQNAVRHALG